MKKRLSHYLRLVRQGEEVTVTDRDTPIATLVPIKSESPPLFIRPRTREPGALKKLAISPSTTHCSLDFLRAERKERGGI